MPEISNIPQELITEHINWHSKPGRPDEGGRRINPWSTPGQTTPSPDSGKEFLVWHKYFIKKFNDWVQSIDESQRPNKDSIKPWTTIPTNLKMGVLGWNTQYAQQESRVETMDSFASLDELGAFLEWSLHGWLHNANATMHNEPLLLGFESPRVTYFWQLHGLLDLWRQKWEDKQ